MSQGRDLIIVVYLLVFEKFRFYYNYLFFAAANMIYNKILGY